MIRRSASLAADRSIGWQSRALRRAAACVAACFVAAGSAAGLDCSAIILDKSDQLSFGRAALGAKRSQLPADAAAPRQCDETCEYVDGAGVKYIVKGDQI